MSEGIDLSDLHLSDIQLEEVGTVNPFDTPPSEESDADPELFCTDCGKSDFKNRRGLKLHQAKMHGAGDSAPKASGTRGRKNAALQKDLEAWITQASFAVMFIDQFDANVIATNASALASAYTSVAARNPKFREFLEKMMTGTGYGEAVMATMMVVLPIMAHHNLLPDAMVKRMGPIMAPYLPQEKPEAFSGFYDSQS